MNKFNLTLRRQNTGRPPVWFMRQAGRYHTHYQKMKEKYTFMELCKQPHVACEATMGPVDDFDFDAAILFSDLLFPLEAIGMGLRYEPGPQLDWHLKSCEDLKRFTQPKASPMAFQGEALKLIRQKLPSSKGLLGFVGGPVTLFAYAVDGRHFGDLAATKAGLKDGRYHAFCEIIINQLAENMAIQATAGADTVAVLDTCAGEFDSGDFKKYILPSTTELFRKFLALCPDTPITYYSKGTGPAHWRMLDANLISCIGIDWHHDIAEVLKEFGGRFSIQGNIDPHWLHLSWTDLKPKLMEVFGKVKALPKEMRAGWVCGLGHGILQKTPEENVRNFIRLQREVFTENIATWSGHVTGNMTAGFSSLLRKYNRPGPRYTSYPTVPYWDTNPTQAQWIGSLDKALMENGTHGIGAPSEMARPHSRTACDSSIGAALYIHIPFCQSLCTYCGCNTRITRNQSAGIPYVETVLKELDLYLTALGKSHSTKNALLVSEIHLGGGTPTFLAPDSLKFLMDGILNRIKTAPRAEFSLEADPRVTSMEHLKVLRERGFTRLSLGIQDFDPKVQQIVHRIQSGGQVRKICEIARTLGYTSLNFDLIYGLPLQTKSSIEETVRIVRGLRPDRIAFYAYAHVPWIKPSHRRFTEKDLPSDDGKRDLYELGRSLLESDGYSEIGMDHFALQTDALWIASIKGALHRNFMGYIPRQVSPLIGLGVSSIGDSWEVFAQNEKVLENYQKRVMQNEIPIHRGHVLNEEDKILRRHILNLMTKFETSWKDTKNQTDTTGYLSLVPEKLREFERDGLITIDDSATINCKILPPGRAFLRNICMAFDARLSAKAPESQLFSKTI